MFCCYDFSYTRRRSSLWACVLSQPQQRQSQQVLSDCCHSVVIFSSLLDKAARKLIKSKCPDARWLKKLNVSLGRYDEFFCVGPLITEITFVINFSSNILVKVDCYSISFAVSLLEDSLSGGECVQAIISKSRIILTLSWLQKLRANYERS